MLPAGGRPATSWVLYTTNCNTQSSALEDATSWVHYTTSCNMQSSAPEDGRDQRPKHVDLIRIINKPLLLHLVGVYIIYLLFNMHGMNIKANLNELDKPKNKI